MRKVHARYFSAICEKPSQMGMPRGRSKMFPINGNPFGPGGYGSLDLLAVSRDLRYLVSAMRETVAPMGITKWESIFGSLSMTAGQKRRRMDRVPVYIGHLGGMSSVTKSWLLSSSSQKQPPFYRTKKTRFLDLIVSLPGDCDERRGKTWDAVRPPHQKPQRPSNSPTGDDGRLDGWPPAGTVL